MGFFGDLFSGDFKRAGQDIKKTFSSVDPTTVNKASTAPIATQQATSANMIKDLQAQQAQIAGRSGPASLNPELINRQQVGNVSYGNVSADPSGAMKRALELQQAAAEGNGPSAAQSLMQAGQDQAVRNQMAMARSGRGGYNPAAVRQAMMAGQQAQQQNIQQNAALRAQEMAQARGDFGTLSTQQGQLAAQIQMNNADKQLQAAMANQGVDLDVLKQNAAAGNQIAMANLDAQLRKLGYDDNMIQAYLGATVGLQGGNLGAATSIYGTQQGASNAATAAKTQIAGGIINAAATGGALWASKNLAASTATTVAGGGGQITTGQPYSTWSNA